MPFNVAPHGSLGYHDYITRQRAQQELEQQQMLANLQADQLRAQTAAMRQQAQLQWAQANPQSFPQYAGAGKGAGVDESMLPEITAPKYLSSDSQNAAPNWNEITPDSLKGTNTIAMSIAPRGGNPNTAEAYYRELVPNPAYEQQRAARASEYTKMFGSPAITASQNALKGREVMAEASKSNTEKRVGAQISGQHAGVVKSTAGDPVAQSFNPTLKGFTERYIEDALSRYGGGAAPIPAQASGGGVGGGQSAAPADVQVEVLGEMNGWKKIRKGGKIYAVKGDQEVPVDE